MKLFTVRDIQVEACLPPFLAANAGTAQRMLSDSARDNGSLLGMHPGDFELICIGEFDEQTGVVTGIDHQMIGNLTEFIGEKE